MGTALKIKADDRIIEKIYHEEEKEVELNNPVAELSVSSGLSRSNTITVADESYVLIRSTLWRSVSVGIYIILLALIMLVLQGLLYKTLGFLLLFIFTLVAEYAFEQFRLEKVEFEDERRF